MTANKNELVKRKYKKNEVQLLAIHKGATPNKALIVHSC